MQCHKCPHVGKFVGWEWKDTPCAECMLRQSKAHVRQHNEVFRGEVPEAEDVKPRNRMRD